MQPTATTQKIIYKVFQNTSTAEYGARYHEVVVDTKSSSSNNLITVNRSLSGHIRPEWLPVTVQVSAVSVPRQLINILVQAKPGIYQNNRATFYMDFLAYLLWDLTIKPCLSVAPDKIHFADFLNAHPDVKRKQFFLI